MSENKKWIRLLAKKGFQIKDKKKLLKNFDDYTFENFFMLYFENMFHIKEMFVREDKFRDKKSFDFFSHLNNLIYISEVKQNASDKYLYQIQKQEKN